MLAGGGGEDLTGGHHALLVGQAYGLAGEDGGVCGFKASHANDGRDDEIRFRQGGADHCAFSAIHHTDAGDTRLAQAGGEIGGQLFSGQRDNQGPPANSLGKGFVHVAASGQGSNREALRKLLDDGERTLPD